MFLIVLKDLSLVYWVLRKSRYERQLRAMFAALTFFFILIIALQRYKAFAFIAFVLTIWLYLHLWRSPWITFIEYIAGQWIFIDSHEYQYQASKIEVLWFNRYGMTLKLCNAYGKVKYLTLFSDQFLNQQEHHFRWQLKMSSIMLKGMPRKTS